MKKILSVMLVMLSSAAFSQQILLEQNVNADTVRPAKGPNLTHYIHGYAGVGFPLVTNGIGSYSKPGASSAFDIGMRYKRKLTNHFAFGLDLAAYFTAYKLKQEQGKTVPDTILNIREKIQVNTAAASAYFRINAGRRGNYIGNYLDLGAYGGWNMVKKHKTTNENADGEKVKVLTGKLKYVENFSYGLMARLGVSRYALTGRYRLSDIFTASSQMPELPRLVVGLEVGLFR